jgi:nitroreductase
VDTDSVDTGSVDTGSVDTGSVDTGSVDCGSVTSGSGSDVGVVTIVGSESAPPLDPQDAAPTEIASPKMIARVDFMSRLYSAAPWQAGTVQHEAIAAAIRSRRTSMFVDLERAVPVETVHALCELATWAPNHKKTWPWRFALFSGDGRSRLGAAMVADMIAADFGDDGKRLKTATKYLRTPATLVVGCASHTNEMLNLENRDAVAAGIQNLLLAATSMGLATFWSTPALTSPPTVLELCGFDIDDRIVGIIYLGWENSSVAPPERPPVVLNHVDA